MGALAALSEVVHNVQCRRSARLQGRREQAVEASSTTCDQDEVDWTSAGTGAAVAVVQTTPGSGELRGVRSGSGCGTIWSRGAPTSTESGAGTCAGIEPEEEPSGSPDTESEDPLIERTCSTIVTSCVVFNIPLPHHVAQLHRFLPSQCRSPFCAATCMHPCNCASSRHTLLLQGGTQPLLWKSDPSLCVGGMTQAAPWVMGHDLLSVSQIRQSSSMRQRSRSTLNARMCGGRAGSPR